MIRLSEEQVAMLKTSNEDIAHGRVVSQDELDEMDQEWLKDCHTVYLELGMTSRTL